MHQTDQFIRLMNRLAIFVLLIAAVYPCAANGQSTTITITNTALQTGINRVGVNLGGETSYDSNQLLNNPFVNPGFNASEYKSIVLCDSGTSAGSCQVNSAPNGNWANDTTKFAWAVGTPVEIISSSENLVTCITTVTSFTAVRINYDTTPSGCNVALAANDYIRVGPMYKSGISEILAIPNYTTYIVGGGTVTAQSSDVPASTSPNKQAIVLTAPTGSDVAGFTFTFDGANGTNYVLLKSGVTYTLSFKAKVTAGSGSISTQVTRPYSLPALAAYATQSITTSWATYTRTFTGDEVAGAWRCASVVPTVTGACGVNITFGTVGAEVIYLDDLSLTSASATGNTTVFRDSVVADLQALKPGVIRMMTGTNFTMEEPDLVSDRFSRHPSMFTRFSDLSSSSQYTKNTDEYSFLDFMDLVKFVGGGAEAWLTIPASITPSDASALVTTIAAYPAYANIPRIYFELGNEVWNSGTSGANYTDDIVYGKRAQLVFSAMKANSSWNSAKMQTIADGFIHAASKNQEILSYCAACDNTDVAPYILNQIQDTATMNQAMLANPQAFDYYSDQTNNGVSVDGNSGDYMIVNESTNGGDYKSVYGGGLGLSRIAARNVYDRASGVKRSVPMFHYEENVGTGQTGTSTISQANFDLITPAWVSGLAMANLESIAHNEGVKNQVLFQFGQHDFFVSGQDPKMWGIIVDSDGPTGGRKRPQYVAAAMLNSVVPQGATVLQTTQTSTPTTSINSTANLTVMPSYNLVTSSAYTNGSGSYSLALFNLDTNSRTVNFAGTNAPTGTVSVSQIAPALTASNESGLNVYPSTSTLSSPTSMTLPPGSMTTLAWASSSGSGNTCTPLNRPAYGPFPAVVNGIDAVDWGVARVQWTSSSMPISLQRIQYATDAEWSANTGVYPHTQGLQTASSVTTNTTPQGWILSNLLPGTTYHVAGQSYDGSTWCAAPDVTFTTLPYPGVVTPQMPAQVTNVASVPTVTGTDYLYGSTCGTSGIVQTRLQDCLNRAKAGDGIGIPPGVYNTGGLQVPNNPNAVQFTVTGSTINSTAHGLSNGQLIRFSSDNQYGGYTTPAPLQPGVTYKVINATANTFQASYDGVTPLTLTNSGGGNLFYLKWPPAPNYVLIHSTAPSSQLPPPGVRFDPVAYGSQVPNLQLNDPNRSIFAPGVFMSYYWFQNLEFSTDPTIATQDSGNGVDPPDFAVPVETSSDNDHIVFNQGAVIPAPPPSRTFYLAMNGSNIVYMNSVIEGFDFWQIYRAIQASSTTSTTYTIPAGSVYWVGANGAKKSCTVASPQTLTFTGGTVGNFAIWIDPTNCNLNAQLQTGLTATGSGFTITSAANPSYPTYSWTGPNSTFTLLNVLAVGTGTVGSGAVSFGDFDMSSSQDAESGVGIHVGNGPGPFLIQNNLIQGTGVAGTYLSDDITSGTGPCGGIGGLPACAPMYNTGDLTEKRNTIRANPCYWAGSACWNGGNYYWRNTDEVKQGKNVWQDGNVWGPFYLQIAQGACVIHVTFTAEFSYATNFLDYADSSNWNFTNNTCQQTPEIVDSVLNYTATAPTYPLSHMRIHNNLFYQDNAYAQIVSTIPQAFGSVVNYDNSQGACPYGKVLQIGGAGDDFQFDHNTIFGLGGCQAWFYNQFAVLSSGNVFTNNIFNLVSDPGTWSVYLGTGTLYQSNASLNPGSSTSDNPDCTGFQASALFACMNYFTWHNNVVLATWTDSHPGSTVDYTNAQIATAAALFPASPATYFPTAGTTMNDRVKQVSWFNPSTGNFRLSKSSPYISGARASTDGLDVGVDMDALEAAQGKVSNVHTYGTTSTSTKIGYLAPDPFGCTVDWGTSNFVTGSGSYTRVANAGGQRVQNVTLSGLPADALIYYRVNCAVQQPTGSIQLP